MRHWKLVLGFVLLCLGGVVSGFVLHFKHKADQLETAKKNLRKLALGIIQCADDPNGNNGLMPPSVVCSKEGKPLYSWRVRILPYIGQKELYEKLKLDEPWDSPHNKPLLAKMPRVFMMPGVETEEGTTYFQVFEGAGTLSSKTSEVRYPTSFMNGTSQTILIIEAANAVKWAAPGDIPYSDHVSPLDQVGHHMGRFTLYVMADATVKQLTSIEDSKLRQSLRPAGKPQGGGIWEE